MWAHLDATGTTTAVLRIVMEAANDAFVPCMSTRSIFQLIMRAEKLLAVLLVLHNWIKIKKPIKSVALSTLYSYF